MSTIRWFGQSWNAGICDPDAHIPTPETETCHACEQPIGNSRGLRIPYSGGDVPFTYWHLDCFLRHTGLMQLGHIGDTN